jgi:NhaA family Na+:H+ antiporter
MTVPASARIRGQDFVAWGREVLDEFEDRRADEVGGAHEATICERSLLHAIETAVNHAEAPLQRMEHALKRPVVFFIMPILAPANAAALERGRQPD